MVVDIPSNQIKTNQNSVDTGSPGEKQQEIQVCEFASFFT